MNHCPTCKCSPTQELRNLFDEARFGLPATKPLFADMETYK